MKKTKRSKKRSNKKKITIEAYNKIMDNIIKMGRPVSDTLIDMLEEASKYKITERKKRRVKN